MAAAAALQQPTNHSRLTLLDRKSFAFLRCPCPLPALSTTHGRIREGRGAGTTLCDPGRRTDGRMTKAGCDVRCRVMLYLDEDVATNYVCCGYIERQQPALALAARVYWIAATGDTDAPS